ncbi:MAG: hypothetical protein MRY79_05060 [Alphaproteobacteria bacterium]|nr:hypothetical protein [Alphaproteobacteria bacterium]
MSQGQKIKTLFHCLNQKPEGNALKVTCEREVNGRKAQFLFAASHLTKALAFAFSYHSQEVLCNGGIEDTQDEFVIVTGRQATLDKPRNIKVFSFSNEGFEEIKGFRQWVSEKPVPFNKTEIVLETDNIDDLMKAGLQIFVVEEDLTPQQKHNYSEQLMEVSSERFIGTMMRAGKMRWLNQERGINANQTFWNSIRATGNVPFHKSI